MGSPENLLNHGIRFSCWSPVVPYRPGHDSFSPLSASVYAVDEKLEPIGIGLECYTCETYTNHGKDSPVFKAFIETRNRIMSESILLGQRPVAVAKLTALAAMSPLVVIDSK